VLAKRRVESLNGNALRFDRWRCLRQTVVLGALRGAQHPVAGSIRQRRIDELHLRGRVEGDGRPQVIGRAGAGSNASTLPCVPTGLCKGDAVHAEVRADVRLRHRAG